MTGRVLLGLALALVASVALNGSFLLQHVGSARAVRITLRRPVASLRGLLGSRLWLVGTTAGLAGATAGAFTAASAGRRRAHGLGIAAGVLYGAGDAATKAATASLPSGGLLAAVLSPWALVVAVASAGAFFCFQRGLQIGPALPVIALMTAATNLVAVAAGLVVFAEPLGVSAAASAAHVVAFGLVGAAAWRLSVAQARMVHARA